jgi:capsular polysaccharide biosynthesis protein
METTTPTDYPFAFKEAVLPVWRRLWVVVLAVLIAVGATLGFTRFQTPIYESNVRLLVGPKKGGASENLGSEIPGLQQLTLTMTSAVESRRVADAVIRELDLSMSAGELLGNLTAEQEGATQFIDVSYMDPDPERGQQIANTVGEVFSEQVSEVNVGANGVIVTVWDSAVSPETPVSPNIPLYVLVALLLGSMLGVALAFLLEQLDDSWRSQEEVEQIAGVPAFGVIPAFRASRGR